MGSSIAKVAARCPIHRSPRAAWLVRFVVCASHNSGRPVGPLLVLLPVLPVLLLCSPPHGPLPSKVNCSRLECLTFLLWHCVLCATYRFAPMVAACKNTNQQSCVRSFSGCRPRHRLIVAVFVLVADTTTAPHCIRATHVSITSSFLGSLACTA